MAILDSTAHAIKFSGFADTYFNGSFPAEFNIIPDPELINTPVLVKPGDLQKFPAPGKPLEGDDFNIFVWARTLHYSLTSNIMKKNNIKY